MENYIETATRIVNEVRRVVIGKDEVIIKVLTSILAGGHILLEDIPGVGKTTMALAFARSMSLDYNRLQFTPDVLPSDVTGFTIFNSNKGEFEYKAGAVMCNLFLADEINRTSSKTQSSLLEVMEEGKVTVDSITREVKKPFIVIATENPVGSVGTQKLPESQLDRFMVCLSMGYPSVESEISILKNKQNGVRISDVNPVADKNEVIEIMEFIKQIHVADEILEYIATLAKHSRENKMLELGLSPRGTIALTALGKANAFMHGRNYVIPSDIKEMYHCATDHRMIVSQAGRIAKKTAHEINAMILSSVPIPDIK